MNEEILEIIKEKGLLLEREVFELFNSFHNAQAVRSFLEGLQRATGQKIITRAILNKNFSFVSDFVNQLPGEDKKSAEKIVLNLGLKLEIRKEQVFDKQKEESVPMPGPGFSVDFSATDVEKKLEISDFIGHFRARYQQIQHILMGRPDLQNLISISKISNERKGHTIIGLVSEKRTTKNKNLIIKFEDLTGEISALVKADKPEAFKKAEELLLDDVVAVKASGSREMLFVNDIIFPEAYLTEKKKFEEEVCIAFLSDVHAGGAKHLQKSFENFLSWISSEDETAKKIKYLFFSGDNVDGVGIFPGQEFLLKLESMREQYALLASYLNKVPKRISMFMCPGQHDAVRVAEPQPPISKRYAEPLYKLSNLILVSNPALVRLKEKEKEFKVLMYHGDSIHTLIHEIPELREIKSAKTPAKAVKHLLRRRHLFSTHSEAIYIPNKEKDGLVISEVPDLLCTGEMHRADIESYNGVLIVVGSCWQGQTPFEEKVGNVPDPCKVPVLNLKTREIKIFDFGDEEELKELHIK